MKTFAYTLVLMLSAVQILAQSIQISGTVKSTQGKALSGANILLRNTYDGASSDSSGRFSFTTTEIGPQVLVVSLIGFASDSLEAVLSGGNMSFSFTLKEALTELNTVTISAGTFEANDKKKGMVLNSLDVATTAGATADIYAALQTLPGTQTSFNENGLFVRGGSAAETKTFFDGMLVRTPFGAQVPDQASRGRFSPFLFKGTSFSAGAYSAVYGQALSSALILESKDLPEKTTTGISLLTVGPSIDHTLRLKNSSISGSAYYYNLQPAFAIIPQNRVWTKAPEQTGGTLHYKLKTSESAMFKLYAEYGHSLVGLQTDNLDDPSAPGQFSNDNKNTYINSSYNSYFGKWKLQSGFSFGNTADNGETNAADYTRTDRFYQAKVTLTRSTGALSTLKFGAETQNTSREESLNALSRKYTDQLTAAYSEADWYLTPRLVARIGLRSEYSSYLSDANIAGRASVGYRANEFNQFAVAYGRFYQNAEDDYLVRQVLDFEQADHYLANYQFIRDSRILRLEAYYKNYDKLVKFSGAGLDNSGDGYARGIDLFWRDRKTFSGVDYWISYSWLDTKRNFRDYPVLSRPTFAAEHTLNAVFKKFFDKLNSQVGTTYTFASGRPYFNPNSAEYLGDRTKNYHNFSLTLSYLTTVFKQFTVLYISANNVPGFKNEFGYRYSSNGQTSKPILPSSDRNVFIGLLMTIGDNSFVR